MHMKCKALHKYYLFVEYVVDSRSFNHTIPLCHIHVDLEFIKGGHCSCTVSNYLRTSAILLCYQRAQIPPAPQ